VAGSYNHGNQLRIAGMGKMKEYAKFWAEDIKRNHRHSWNYNIKTGLRELGYDSLDWIHLAQDRDQWRALMKTVMNLRES